VYARSVFYNKIGSLVKNSHSAFISRSKLYLPKKASNCSWFKVAICGRLADHSATVIVIDLCGWPGVTLKQPGWFRKLVTQSSSGIHLLCMSTSFVSSSTWTALVFRRSQTPRLPTPFGRSIQKIIIELHLKWGWQQSRYLCWYLAAGGRLLVDLWSAFLLCCWIILPWKCAPFLHGCDKTHQETV
jgi:hypothetical protein